jgi:hypothetical protein
VCFPLCRIVRIRCYACSFAFFLVIDDFTSLFLQVFPPLFLIAHQKDHFATFSPSPVSLFAQGTGVYEGSRKAFAKEFKKVIDVADVILEVLDARDPLGCRCASLERQVLAAGSGKRLVLVLNKVDLVGAPVLPTFPAYLC